MPVAVNIQDRGVLARRVGQVEVGRHPDVRAGLEDQFFDAVTVALQGSEDLGFKRTRIGGKPAPGVEQAGADGLALGFPIIEALWWCDVGPECLASRLLNEFQVMF